MKKTLVAITLVLATALHAEEGMWPFNMIPVDSIEKNYGVSLDREWVEHVQKSCLRISAGGSGSFVSPYGLVMTNHHVGSTPIFNLSTKEEDLIDKGFYATSMDQERKCPNLHVDVLISIRDVTSEVNRNASTATSAAEREQARKAAIAEISKKAQEETGLQPEIVTLYHGAKYDLYLYKRYTDVRLVMAPEKSIAYLGGDEDNFEYPRYNLDACFFRVYENDQPLKVEHYLKWSASGPKVGEGLFVAGHPGRTERLLTSDHLQFVKEVDLPLILQAFEGRKKALYAFAKESPENKRIAGDPLAVVENSHKALSGVYRGFSALPVIQDKQAYEKELLESASGDHSKPWSQLKTALDSAKSYYPSYWVLEGRGSRYEKLYAWAKILVRSSLERGKPNDQRLKEYTDTILPILEQSLFSTEPIYSNLEEVLLIDGLLRMEKILGKDHPAVIAALDGKTPEAKAKEIMSATRLTDLQVRKDLYSSPEAILKSTDPMIQLAKALDPYAREVRKTFEDEFESVQNESYAEIAKIIFDRYGESNYPDATFTLRLATGRMEGYKDKGTEIAPMTTLGGAYEHAKAHGFKDPYALPTSWLAKENALDKKTPLNFVLTNDIIGGNSGSPTINSKGEVVGLIFDGNIQSLIWDYQFDETQGRAVAVHSQGIIEALDKVYGAHALVKEILEAAPPPQKQPGFFGTLYRYFAKKN